MQTIIIFQFITFHSHNYYNSIYSISSMVQIPLDASGQPMYTFYLLRAVERHRSTWMGSFSWTSPPASVLSIEGGGTILDSGTTLTLLRIWVCPRRICSGICSRWLMTTVRTLCAWRWWGFRAWVSIIGNVNPHHHLAPCFWPPFKAN